ncbi:MAG: phytanoyl-CoA dioxygenase family protein [Chloroflexi bacterium]|nr:phytanoyl-CoA dioxygenase family protein [Chloroflexota bacterium]
MGTVIDPVEADRIRRRLYRTDESARGRILETCPDRLSEEDVQFYRGTGYLAMKGLLRPSEVDEAKSALSDLMAKRIAWDDRVKVQEEPYYRDGHADERVTDPELRVRKVWEFCQIEPRLQRIGFHPRLVPWLEQLVGPGFRMTQDMALIKPPFRGSEKPWHQDTAYFDWMPLEGIIGVWIALDPATVENGCMQVIPGTHLLGPAGHFHLRDCQLPDARVQVSRAVVIPLDPGGILLFSGLLHHGTPPNLSGDRRRALQYHYAAAHCRQMTLDEHAGFFNEGGAYAGCRRVDPKSGIHRAVYEA